jgi:hypothetical protein
MPSQLLNHENNGKTACPDPEVLEKPVRRQFTAAYKLEMVEAADRCSELGSGLKAAAGRWGRRRLA